MAMYDEQLLKDFDDAMANVQKVIDWLKKIYYQPDVTSIINQPRISVLLTGADFINTNLRELKQLYLLKAGK